MRVLVPVGMSPNSEGAVRQAVRRFRNDSRLEIHLLNVQPAFGHYMSRFIVRSHARQFHREESEKALKPAVRILDGLGIPYAVHMKVGDGAKVIAETARRLHCDEIIMGTARTDSLTRLIESSITNRVIDLTSVPVEVVPGEAITGWERYGIPAAMAGALAALFLAASD
jgi:nucleotide-binding universal stress UspA family protein